MKENKMNTETALSNDTIEKLKKLLSCFNSGGQNIDMYSLCIKKILFKESIS